LERKTSHFSKRRDCAICGKSFLLTAPNKKYCSPDCDPHHHSSRKKKPLEKAATFKIEEFENELEVEDNYLKQLKDIAKQVFRFMKVEKLEKLTDGAGEWAREIMIKTQKHLNKELNGSIKNERVIINYESE